jgi:polyhydroxyalkanoate synthesis regulator phasin
MQTDPAGIVWLSDSQQVLIDDLVELSGLNADEIKELVESGALEPTDPSNVPWTFSAECVVTVRQATRLRDELELDPHAVAVALSLLEQIRHLELEVARLQAQLSRI